jgi:hypothetical protein
VRCVGSGGRLPDARRRGQVFVFRLLCVRSGFTKDRISVARSSSLEREASQRNECRRRRHESLTSGERPGNITQQTICRSMPSRSAQFDPLRPASHVAHDVVRQLRDRGPRRHFHTVDSTRFTDNVAGSVESTPPLPCR